MRREISVEWFRIPNRLVFAPRGGEFDLAEVNVQEGETLESALRRFKRKVQQEDIIKDVRKHSFYMKPGEKKRVKQAQALKCARKKGIRREPTEDRN